MQKSNLLGPVYLDQNIISELRAGKSHRDPILWSIRQLQEAGATIVYSMTHIDECRASDQPHSFIEALNTIDAHLLKREGADCAEISLWPAQAAEFLIGVDDATDEAAHQMNNFLKFLHFTAGWLDELEASSLLNEVITSFEMFWEELLREVPSTIKLQLEAKNNEMLSCARDVPLSQLKDEGSTHLKTLRAELPQSYAQLDAVPAEDLVEFLFCRLPQEDETAIRLTFPKGFWAKVENREEGQIVGLALLLFHMGAVRDNRVWTGPIASRHKHYLGQFRDGQHIEEASRCSLFATFDQRAARLARAVYSYAGATTEVALLRRTSISDEKGDQA